MGLLSILGGLVAPVTSLVEGWQARKEAKLKSDLAIQTAKTAASIKRMETAQNGDISWENTQINNSGWKDEYWTIILSIPCVLCFIPGCVGYVVKGFEALDKTPKWYQWALGVSIAASFGYRKIADFMQLKKGV